MTQDDGANLPAKRRLPRLPLPPDQYPELQALLGEQALKLKPSDRATCTRCSQTVGCDEVDAHRAEYHQEEQGIVLFNDLRPADAG